MKSIKPSSTVELISNRFQRFNCVYLNSLVHINNYKMAFLNIIFVVLAMAVSTAFGGILPYASSYNAHTINHAIATPVAPLVAAGPAPIVAAAPAPYVASPYVASPYVASPYVASPYAAYSYPHSHAAYSHAEFPHSYPYLY